METKHWIFYNSTSKLGKLTIDMKNLDIFHGKFPFENLMACVFAHLLWWWKFDEKWCEFCQIKISSTWILHFNEFSIFFPCMNTIMYVLCSHILSCKRIVEKKRSGNMKKICKKKSQEVEGVLERRHKSSPSSELIKKSCKKKFSLCQQISNCHCKLRLLWTAIYMCT